MRHTIILILLLLAAGCATNPYMRGKKLADEGDYDRAAAVLYEAIAADPQNAEAWRELGVTFYKKGDLDKAEEALKQADHIRPDARTSLYIGLTFEKREAYDKAIEAYRSALSLRPKGQTNNLIRAHLDQLVARKVEREVQLAISREGDIDVDTIPDNTIAVVDFDDQHLPPELKPISKGLAEFTSLDLAKVHSLRVVERLKINEIMKELEMAASDAADPATAPRVGRLLGSRSLVTGSVLGIGEESIRLNGAVVNTADRSAELTEPTEGDLNRIFKLQKVFVFQILDSLGVKLTVEERNAIAKVPTESHLAFLAYCRGLDFRSRGMLRDAGREFNQAAEFDGQFFEANVQVKALSYTETPGYEDGAAPETFEQTTTAASDGELASDGLDQLQETTLDLSGFMREPEDFSSGIRRTDVPPQTGEVRGIVIIRGYFDAPR